jgi:uncharacterized protein YndB with AHSA1/START domain
MEEKMPATAAKTASTSSEFVISRVYDAPRALLWKAFTEPERMQQWFSPKGFTAKVAKMDLRPGGMYHYCLRTPDGKEMWGKAVYREIAVPERLVWVNSFSDERGGTTRHPMSPSWPLEMLTTVTLAEQGSKTRLTVQWIPLNPSEKERRTFDGGHDSMTQGWTGTLDQLGEYLARARA